MPTAWTDEMIATVQRGLSQASKATRRTSLPVSPKGESAPGVADYRGFPLQLLSQVDAEDVDFGGARSPSNQFGVDTLIQIKACRLRRVTFDRAGVFYVLDGIFDQCSFARISAKKCSFQGLFRGCEFRRSNLGDANLGGDFSDCLFESVKFSKTSWGASFQNCRFVDCTLPTWFPELTAIIRPEEAVTFSVDGTGRVRPGEVIRFSKTAHLLEGW